MDLYYVLQNAIIYWILAFILSWFLAYNKYINFSLWSFLVLSWYVINVFYGKWFSFDFIIILSIFILSFFIIDYIVSSNFSNLKKREFFGFIFTLAVGILIENSLSYVYWPSSISLNWDKFNTIFLLSVFLLLFFTNFYFYKYSIIWKLFNWLYENSRVVESLWVKMKKKKNIFFLFCSILILFAWYISMGAYWLSPSENIYFIIKAIWIMIVVWVWRMQYMFLWALLYVVLEYVLFVNIGIPIVYKEPLVLGIILVILIFKPNGLFSLDFRKI